MNELVWKETQPSVGPSTHYGYWQDAKCFSIHLEIGVKGHGPARYIIKSNLPGFRPDLPPQTNVPEAQAFCERMLQRWVAKRGLLFKSHVICTDAMVVAARAVMPTGVAVEIDNATICKMVEAALTAREPHAPSNINQQARRNPVPSQRRHGAIQR